MKYYANKLFLCPPFLTLHPLLFGTLILCSLNEFAELNNARRGHVTLFYQILQSKDYEKGKAIPVTGCGGL
jgi:hypothetical protein